MIAGPHLCIGRWEIAVTAPVPDGAVADLPLPEARYCSTFAFTAWEPQRVASHFDAASGLLRSVPLGGSRGIARLACTFRLGRRRAEYLEPPAHDPDLRPSGVPGSDPAVRHALDQAASWVRSRTALPWALHEWVMRNIADGDGAARGGPILETRVGDAAGRARLFADLCRLSGIPARERQGAVLALNEMRYGGHRFSRSGYAINPFSARWVACLAGAGEWSHFDFPHRKDAGPASVDSAYRIPCSLLDGPELRSRIPCRANASGWKWSPVNSGVEFSLNVLALPDTTGFENAKAPLPVGLWATARDGAPGFN